MEHYSCVVMDLRFMKYSGVRKKDIQSILRVFFLFFFPTSPENINEEKVAFISFIGCMTTYKCKLSKCRHQFIVTSLKITLHTNTAAEENDTQCYQFKNVEL